MGKYSPAPWKACEVINSGKYQLESQEGENRSVVCYIDPCCNIENNLPLIESAPDLLRAAKGALSYLDSIPNWEDEPNPYAEDLRQAIAKAVERGVTDENRA